MECKLADRVVDRGLRCLMARFPTARAIQIPISGHRDFVTPEGIRVMPAVDFLPALV